MSDQREGLSYSVDLALCVDATGSMSPVIDLVKENALRFYDDVMRSMAHKQKRINDLRTRVIVFRDLHVDGSEAIIASPFFKLPDERSGLADFVGTISASGGGDEPESGLEALAEAIRSDWVRTGDRRRHVVVLWTDASAHRLEDATKRATPGYPTDMPGSFGEITALWEGQKMDRAAKRLLIYAPDAYPWNDIQGAWENVVHIVSKAGQGLQEVDYSGVIEVIANSI
ncbi:MAG TPA: hypothetical protein VMU82_04680 [Acetobacteraceae bacterium]|nr:hypothetical protein [Acetobacteraceae bacterium]